MKTTNIKFFFIHFLLIFFLLGCSDNSAKTDKDVKISIGIEADKVKALKKYYELPHIEEFYAWQNMSYSSPPKLEYPKDLSTLSYGDLKLLRNEVFARNGYLFNDGFLRGYFNRFKWYMPIFDVPTFKVVLNKDEQRLINYILKEEKKRKKNKTINLDGLHLFNADLIVNNKQFADIPKMISDDLKEHNFSIVPSNRALPFYVYDKNAYKYIPHYITTDLYLFILHKYFSKSLEKLDENFMSSELIEILNKVAVRIETIKNTDDRHQFELALEWAQMYNALALYAADGYIKNVHGRYKTTFEKEVRNIDQCKGRPIFIMNPFVNYAELKPRGHYTKSEKLRKYFKAFKWMSLSGIDLDNDEQLKGMIVLAYIIKNDEDLFVQYKRYIEIVEKIAGQEDNLSILDIIYALPEREINKELSDNWVDSIRKELSNFKKEKVKQVFGESFQIDKKLDERGKKRVYFISSTYSISGEILSRLVHVDLDKSKRPFPKGLDIPAVFGSQTAYTILVDEYKEDKCWPEYLPRLKKLQKQFRSFNKWDYNYGFKAVQTALSAFGEGKNYPDFMKTNSYNRKELNTTLSSWTHIKHDLILYQEKPVAAEAGQGGGPEPPQQYSYVEPNIIFWNTALELTDWLKGLTGWERTYYDELKRIEDLGELLRGVAYKQINGEEITKEEYKELHYVGGTVEHILLGLLGTDHLPEREKSMALIADIYAYNDENLNVAVGNADDIYVVVPINGEYYIARGAVFSYYEFKGKIYDDEEWRRLINTNQKPERPEWIRPIISRAKPLIGQTQYRYPGHGAY